MRRLTILTVVLAVILLVSQGATATDVTFTSPVPGTIADINGLGTGFTHRMPGTGSSLPMNDPNLNLLSHPGRLMITSTRADFNHGGVNLGQLEAVGLFVPCVGIGDITVSALFRDIHMSGLSDQLLLFAGSASNKLVRAGLHMDTIGATGSIICNNGGFDDPVRLFMGAGGAAADGDDVLLTLRRTAGLWSLSWLNLSNPPANGSSPSFALPWLDGEPDLYVGIHYSNPGNSNPKTSELDYFSVELPAPCSRGDFVLAVPVDAGGPPSQWGGVSLFGFATTAPLLPMPSIPAILVNDPVSAAFSPRGELFVGNRFNNEGGGLGSISRFTLDHSGRFTPNGTITGNGLEAVHCIAFGPQGELFATSVTAGTVSRFLFDQHGTAIPNGTFFVVPGIQGLAFAPWGELFVPIQNEVRRFRFGDTGEAIPNGSFTIPGSSVLLGLRFAPTGELLIADVHTGLVYRCRFDAAHNPILNGTVSVFAAASVAFSPLGELFVSSFEAGGGIYRFLFDSQGNAVANGFVASFPAGFIAITRLPSPGDFNHDADVDLSDFATFQTCFNGPNRPAGDNCMVNADLDGDGDVDLSDFAMFQTCFNGPNRPPACL